MRPGKLISSRHVVLYHITPHRGHHTTYPDSSRSLNTGGLLSVHLFSQMRNAVKIKTIISPTIDTVKSQLHITEVFRFITIIRLFTLEQFSALAATYHVGQPALEEIIGNFAELLPRLFEIQSGERQRSPEPIAEDGRAKPSVHPRT